MAENSERVTFITNEHYLLTALAVITAAQNEILIINFSMETGTQTKNKRISALYAALIKKAAEGVKIKILLNGLKGKNSIARSNIITAELMKKKSIEIRTLETWRTIHAKIIIQDFEKMLIGSHNWTTRAITANLEASVLIKNDSAIKNAIDFFNLTWVNAIIF